MDSASSPLLSSLPSARSGFLRLLPCHSFLFLLFFIYFYYLFYFIYFFFFIFIFSSHLFVYFRIVYTVPSYGFVSISVVERNLNLPMAFLTSPRDNAQVLLPLR